MSESSRAKYENEFIRELRAELPKETLVDKIWKDFFHVEQQLDAGLQVLLEACNVPKDTRRTVAEYMQGVIKGLAEVEKEVVKLARAPGAERAGYGDKGRGR